MKFSTQLRNYRELAGFSIPELSKLTGISQHALYSWEQGTAPYPSKLNKVTEATGWEFKNVPKIKRNRASTFELGTRTKKTNPKMAVRSAPPESTVLEDLISRIVEKELRKRNEHMTWHVPALAGSLALAVVGLALV